MENKKLKVVWIAPFRNNEIRKELQFKRSCLTKLINILKKGESYFSTDSGQWVTNGINEFKKFNDIELHVITYSTNLNKKVVYFIIDGINYHIYNSSIYSIIGRLRSKLGMSDLKHTQDRTTIQNIIKQINPDIIHIIGAENPQYSISALDMPKDKPLLVSLQTLMSVPGFLENYPINKETYEYRSSIERKVLERADYIGTKTESHKEFIIKEIDNNANILHLRLALGVDSIIDNSIKKVYDFVYFANNINKAFDDALECFAIAKKKHKHITMNVIGSYDEDYIQRINNRIKELGITGSITFEGRLATHHDVMLGIQKSRFALLPLKVDLISGTIREAMIHGLPTLSTITPATPNLNAKRKSILLSEIGDYISMANNMCKLLENDEFAQELGNNGIKTIEETFNNNKFMEEWRKAYYQIIENFHNNTPFTQDIKQE